MKRISESIKHGITGMLIGSFCYLMVLMFQNNSFDVNKFSIITILIASFLTGITSQMIGNEKICTGITYLIHLGSTLIIFFVTFYLNGWITNLRSLTFMIINFIVIYIFVWIGLIIWNRLNASEINKQLKKMKHE
ncbi:DUF3021 domain-containing protein [Fructilactobacillus sp. Tb1]|uniref:DUF3021 domain-containing protein n=1 Tax=Fructilactobacillus sp. Tb1 TaxID=3422304 RepID=UPI003D298BB1